MKLVPGAERLGTSAWEHNLHLVVHPRHTAAGETAHITFHVILPGVVLRELLGQTKER